MGQNMYTIHSVTSIIKILNFKNSLFTCKADVSSDGAFQAADIRPAEPRKNSICRSSTSIKVKVMPAVGSTSGADSESALAEPLSSSVSSPSPTRDSNPSA